MGTVVAVHLPIIEGRTPVEIIVDVMPAVTTNKGVDVVRR